MCACVARKASSRERSVPNDRYQRRAVLDTSRPAALRPSSWRSGASTGLRIATPYMRRTPEHEHTTSVHSVFRACRGRRCVPCLISQQPVSVATAIRSLLGAACAIVILREDHRRCTRPRWLSPVPAAIQTVRPSCRDCVKCLYTSNHAYVAVIRSYWPVENEYQC